MLAALVKIDVGERQRLTPKQKSNLGRNRCCEKQQSPGGAAARASGSGRVWEPCLASRWATGSG